MMVMPIPAWLLDGLLAFSLAIAVGVFLIALFIEQPLEYSVFPAVVLVATLLRLSLNVASTRLILLHGAEGQRGAGRVIETFGKFVVGGDVIVGLVVFLILVIINFVVITKGAGRVAEVSARFTLDAMPGKQMAIDADLNGGLITPDIARERRRTVEREADFFGAMDGASKFVHGDAVAGLVITAVNLVGGLVRGLVSGMDIGQAVETFSILSVGDALVAQIPSLLISTASGIVVTRGATGEELGAALRTQIFSSKRAIFMTGGVLGAMALIPGMPAFPFLLIGGSLFAFAWNRPNDGDETPVPGQKVEGGEAGEEKREDIEATLGLDALSLELGYELIPAVEASMGGTLLERIAGLRRQFAVDMGVIVPPVRIRDNLALLPSEYRISILGTEVARGDLRQGRLIAMGEPQGGVDVPGDATKDPVFGEIARWIAPKDRDLAEAFGCTVVDHATVLATHISEVVRRNGSELLGRAELAHLFEVFSKDNPKLFDDLVPSLLSLSDVQKVLRNLLREGVSIRNLRTILEGLTDTAPQTKDTEQLTEIVRQRLARQITAQHKGASGELPAIVLDAPVEDMFRRSLRELTQGGAGGLDPAELRRVSNSLEEALARLSKKGQRAPIVTGPDLRRYVRAFVERRNASCAVISYREVDPLTRIVPVETIRAN
jgi:flagellar biosynthesis protein FlhA